MSFFDKLKQAMGFDGQCDDDDEKILNESSPKRHIESMSSDTRQTSKPQAASDTVDADMKVTADLIFVPVLELFNDQLPSFVRDSVDPATQRKLIYERLDDGIKTHLQTLAAEAHKCASQRFEAEQERLKNEINDLREAEKRAEENGQESNQQRLSAERQKRALAERVRDLEKQVAAFDAEREQYELENKSLVNRLRLLQVSENNADADDDTAATILQLTDRNKELTEENEALAQQNKSLTEANEALTVRCDELKDKNKISDAMINELNAKTSDALHRLADNENAVQRLEEADQRIKQLSAQCDNLQKRYAEAETAAEQGRMAVQAISEIQQELLKLETAKNKREARISELIDENADKDEQIDLLRAEIRRLNTVIEEMPAQVAEGNGPYVASRTVIDIADDTIADTDWSLAPNKSSHSGRKRHHDSDDDFGYQEPKRRKSYPDDPAQMSLF